MRPFRGRLLVSLTFVTALLLMGWLRLFIRRRVRGPRARTRHLIDEKKRVSIRQLGLAAAGVTVTLAVMGGSLALALGVLGEEEALPGPAPLASAGDGGAPVDGSLRPPPRFAVTPVPATAGSEGVAVGGDLALGPPPSSSGSGIPENVNASAPFLALKDALAQAIADYAAEVGIDAAIAVTDMQTGETISVSGNVAHRTGCTINLFALLATVGEFEAGRADPQSVAYSIRVGIGGSYPPQVRRFLEATFPSYQAGVDRAQQLMRSWGMKASAFYQVPYYQIGTQINQLTALEVNLILSKLYRGELFEPEWTAYTLARLREVNWGLNYMLPGQLPATATVAHKIGFYADLDGWVNNDAGVVTFTGSDGKEKAYAITYLSQRARTEYTGYSHGARLSRLAWDYFAAKYGAGAEPPPPPPPEPTPPPPEPTSASPEPTPQPTRTPSPTPKPTPTASPTPASTASPTPSPSATP